MNYIRKRIIIISLIAFALLLSLRGVIKYANENKIFKEVIARLEADSRLAEVLVTGVNYDDKRDKVSTTIKFLEYDVEGKPLIHRYFTFSGNIIQFQSLVIRFDDIHIKRGDKLRGKSAVLFWKIFMLDGRNTEEYEITRLYTIPQGYKLENKKSTFEEKLWKSFWKYALNPKEADKLGIKNAQIEAPGVTFIPGMLYTVKIEHDGGLRIDSSPLPVILKGERIPR